MLEPSRSSRRLRPRRGVAPARRFAGLAVVAVVLSVVGPSVLGAVAPGIGSRVAPESCASATEGVRVGLVIDYGILAGEQGAPVTPSRWCATVAERANGFTILEAGGHTYAVNGSNLLCSIDGYPRAPECGDRTSDGYRYWAYFTGDATGWHYAGIGPSGFQTRTAHVQGWHFVQGAGNPSDPAPNGPSDPNLVCAPPPTTAPPTSATVPTTTPAGNVAPGGEGNPGGGDNVNGGAPPAPNGASGGTPGGAPPGAAGPTVAPGVSTGGAGPVGVGRPTSTSPTGPPTSASTAAVAPDAATGDVAGTTVGTLVTLDSSPAERASATFGPATAVPEADDAAGRVQAAATRMSTSGPPTATIVVSLLAALLAGAALFRFRARAREDL